LQELFYSTYFSLSSFKCTSNAIFVQQEVPWEAETYLHRIGRAGRFGSYGVAVSLPSEGLELDILRNIAFQTGSQISILPIFNPEEKECLPDLWKIQQVLT
jgi:superfamily II DNA/RNA helicase